MEKNNNSDIATLITAGYSEDQHLTPHQHAFQKELINRLATWFDAPPEEVFWKEPVGKYFVPVLIYYQLMYVFHCGGDSKVPQALIARSFPDTHKELLRALGEVQGQHRIEILTNSEYRKDFLAIAIQMRPLARSVRKQYISVYSEDALAHIANLLDSGKKHDVKEVRDWVRFL